MEPLHVDSALAELRWLLALAAGRRVEVVVECEPNLPPVRVDAVGFRRSVLELVEKAGATVADRGQIAVRAAGEPGRVVLTVADAGSIYLPVWI
jgi:hypothetical protein